MGARYEVYLCRDTGERLTLLSEYFSLAYTIVQHDVGICVIELPGTLDPAFIRPDYKIAIWRQPEGGSMALEDVYLIRRYRAFTSDRGERRWELTGLNGNSIMTDRAPNMSGTYRVGYKVEDYADDAIKTIVNGSYKKPGTVYFSIEADKSQGASFKKAIGARSLADEATARCKTSAGRGTPIFWHVAALSEAQYQLRTYLDQIGQDRSWPDGNNPILVSESDDTMGEPAYEWDGIEARNRVWALGDTYTTPGGEIPYAERAHDRLAGAENTLSQYSHREKFVDAGSETDYDVLVEAAVEELAESYPVESLGFNLKETETRRYGRDWRFGDVITAFYRERYYSCRIFGVTVKRESQNTPEKVQVDLDIVRTTDVQTS